VSSPKELRSYADECLGWARTARSDKEREIFLMMARTWLEAAERMEGRRPHAVINPVPQDEISAK
jgi:hypothetical protein